MGVPEEITAFDSTHVLTPCFGIWAFHEVSQSANHTVSSHKVATLDPGLWAVQAPMMPLTETLITICIEKFGVAPEDAGALLGSEGNIRAALTSAGFRHIQASHLEAFQ